MEGMLLIYMQCYKKALVLFNPAVPLLGIISHPLDYNKSDEQRFMCKDVHHCYLEQLKFISYLYAKQNAHSCDRILCSH